MPIEDQLPTISPSEQFDKDTDESLDIVNAAAERSRSLLSNPPLESELTQTGTTMTRLHPEWKKALSKKGETEASPRVKTIATRAGAAALSVAIAGGAAFGLHEMAGGSDNPNRGETISADTITINEDARFRNDPYVPDGDPNIALNNPLTSPTEINVKTNSIHISEDANGEWYGIPIEEMKGKVPGIEDAQDKDGVIWINQQGIDSVGTSPDNESGQ